MNSLLKKLEADFPNLSFVNSDDFMWSPSERIIYYDSNQPEALVLLLHELAHADLGHEDYDRDINLIKREREAWHHASNILAPKYDLVIDEDIIESTLDTYRDWLHSRSTCPECGTIGIQTKKRSYNCLSCHMTWRVNEARSCALRRYKEKKIPE